MGTSAAMVPQNILAATIMRSEEDKALIKKAHDILMIESAPLTANGSNNIAVPAFAAPATGMGLHVKGPNFEKELSMMEFLDTLIQSGFQATNLGQAIEEVRRMLKWRLSDDEPREGDADEWLDPERRRKTRCTIWLSFTSNMISSGLREVICFLAKHRFIDVLVTSAGGVEEDFIKCLGETVVGAFTLKGADLRKSGWNRIGNLIMPNDNYCKFEDWLQPILDKMLLEQREKNTLWTASKIVERLGHEINDESSVFYWCAKNDIPVFCPGITDGSLGDNLFLHSYRNPGLVVDCVEDVRLVNMIAIKAKKSGIIILGGGIAKHHVCNANLLRNGADFAVYVNTAQEYDGCDSGASPDEAVSWGKIRMDAKPVKVIADATVVFPMLVAATFAEEFRKEGARPKPEKL